MAVPRAGAVGGRDGGQPVTGGTRGCAWAAARRVPQVQTRSCQSGCGESPAGAWRPHPLSASIPLGPPGRATSREINAPFGARRAPRALESVRESSHEAMAQ